MGPLGVATMLGRAGWSARSQWRALPADRRSRLQTLARRSRGRPSGLSVDERRELTNLVRELELGRIARQSALSAALPRRRFRRGN